MGQLLLAPIPAGASRTVVHLVYQLVLRDQNLASNELPTLEIQLFTSDF